MQENEIENVVVCEMAAFLSQPRCVDNVTVEWLFLH